MINWLYSEVVTGKIDFPKIWSSRGILISVSASVPTVWRKAGYLRVEALINDDFFTTEVKPISFGSSLIAISVTAYRLSFEPVESLLLLYPNTSIKITELSATEVNTIMPMYSVPLPKSIAEQPVVDSIPTTFAAPSYAAAALPIVYQALPANARQTFAVSNQGSSDVYLDLDPPSSATKRFVTIGPGNTWLCDFPYVGAVFLWSSVTGSQSCEIRELIQ
jgi:hypothetical protein